MTCRVFLHIITSPTEIQTQGVAQGQLILMRQELNGLPPDTDQRGLTLGVSGDTLLAVTYQAQNLPMSRPLTLDLLWQVCTSVLAPFCGISSYCTSDIATYDFQLPFSWVVLSGHQFPKAKIWTRKFYSGSEQDQKAHFVVDFEAQADLRQHTTCHFFVVGSSCICAICMLQVQVVCAHGMSISWSCRFYREAWRRREDSGSCCMLPSWKSGASAILEGPSLATERLEKWPGIATAAPQMQSGWHRR